MLNPRRWLAERFRLSATDGTGRLPSISFISQLFKITAYVIITAIIGILFFIYFSGNGYGLGFYNSDLIHPFLLAQDIIDNPSLWWSWSHSPAPYIFPDIFIAIILAIIKITPAGRPIVYASFLFLGYVIFTASILSALYKIRFEKLIIWSLSGFTILLFIPSFFYPYKNFFIPYLLAPFIHSGAALGYIISLYLLISIRDSSKTKFFNLFLCSFIFCFSDRLYIIWFIFPAILSLLILSIQHSKFYYKISIFILTVSSVTASGLAYWVHPDDSGYFKNSTIGIKLSVEIFLTAIKNNIYNGDFSLLISLVCSTLLFFKVAMNIFRFREIVNPVLHFIESNIILTIIFGMVAPILSGHFLDEAHVRYIIILPVAVTIWLLAIACEYTLRRKFFDLEFSAVTAALTISIYWSTSFSNHAQAASSEIFYCLNLHDRELVHEPIGMIGDYWTAKRNIYLSNRAIGVFQVDANGTLLSHNYNRNWNLPPRAGGNFASPTIIAMARLNREAIVSRHGDPNLIISCGSEEIWLYKKHLVVERESYPARSLSHQIGVIEGDYIVVRNTDPGLILFGPHITLPRGRYRIDIPYRADGMGNRWEITADAGRRIILSGALTIEANGSQLAEIDVAASQNQFEVRVFYGGLGTLAVSGFQIRRR